MPNRLKDSTSSYLLAHADNPVDWYPWGEEALERAKKENKPIFLSIGYSACHWCHVMEREAFRNPETADILNRLFVPIKVDREERPDLDKIFMQSVLLMTGQGGWPMSVWLTPDLKPFYGGTYFPARPQNGLPSLAQLSLSLAHSWKNKEVEVRASAEKLHGALLELEKVSFAEDQYPTSDRQEWFDWAIEACQARFDEVNGGFGVAPKFPQPMVLSFLLHYAVQESDADLFHLVELSAEKMARGGLFDQLGGGFHRYCVDPAWTVPHFEKMLYDNALMLEFYAELYGATETPLARWICETLFRWLEEEMKLPTGGYAASQDADSEEGEGAYFRWTPGQLEEILEPQEREIFSTFFQVTRAGNFQDGSSVLSQPQTMSRCAKELGWEFELAVSVLAKAKAKALEARQQRPRPKRDDKLIGSWNSMLLSALCRAARLLGGDDFRKAAEKLGLLLLERFVPSDHLPTSPRHWAQGAPHGRATSEDLGGLILGFWDLYELTLQDRYQAAGEELYRLLESDYWDEERGLVALTASGQDDLPHRPFSFEDNATPSGHSLFLECARRRHLFRGDEASQHRLEKGLQTVQPLLQRAPTGLGFALRTALLSNLLPSHLMLRLPQERREDFLAVLNTQLLPTLQVVSSDTPGVDPVLLEGREGEGAWLCWGGACQPKAATPEELRARFEAALSEEEEPKE